MYLEAMHIRFLLVGGIACREKDSFRCFDILCIHKSCSWEGAHYREKDNCQGLNASSFLPIPSLSSLKRWQNQGYYYL